MFASAAPTPQREYHVPLLKVSFALFYLLYPFLNVGFRAGAYSVSLSTLALFAVNGALVLYLLLGHVKLDGHTIVWFGIFLVYIVGVTFWRVETDVWLFSTLALVMMIFPFLTAAPHSNLLAHNRRWFLWGHYLNWGILVFSVAGQFVPALDPANIVPIIEEQRTDRLFGDFFRINGLMVEPAWLGRYLVFGYIVNDMTTKNDLWRFVSNLIFAFFLAVTASFGAFLLWGVYLGYRVVERGFSLTDAQLRLRTIRFVDRRILLALVVTAIVIMAGVGLLAAGALDPLFEYVARRIRQVNRFLAGDFDLVRLESVTLFFRYPFTGSIIGEGYSNIEPWILANTNIDNANIHNLYSILMIGTGVIGVGLYLLAIVSLAVRVPRGWLVMLGIWLLIGFATGRLIFYDMWGYLMLFALYDRSTQPAAITERPPLEFDLPPSEIRTGTK